MKQVAKVKAFLSKSALHEGQDVPSTLRYTRDDDVAECFEDLNDLPKHHAVPGFEAGTVMDCHHSLVANACHRHEVRPAKVGSFSVILFGKKDEPLGEDVASTTMAFKAAHIKSAVRSWS